MLLYSFVCFTCIGGKVCVYMGGRQQGQKEAPVPALAPSPALLTPQGWGRQGQGHLLMCWGQAHVAPAVTAAHRGSPSGSVLLWVCLISVQLSPVSCPTQGSCVIRVLLRQQKNFLSPDLDKSNIILIGYP